MGETSETQINVLVQTADFIVKYGFLAVGLVLIFLIAPAIQKIWHSKRLSFASVCFGLAFVVTYGALSLISVVAPSLISSQRSLIRGTVLGVANGFQTQMRTDLWRVGQAYSRREVDAQNGGLSNFPFIIMTRDAPGCLSLVVSSTDPNSDTIFAFDIKPLTQDDLDVKSEIVARLLQKPEGPVLQVWRERDEKPLGEAQTVKRLGETVEGCSRTTETRTTGWSIIDRAFAQAASPLSQRLMSDDAFVRREARIEIANMGETAFGTISELLESKTYRLELGGLVALAGLTEEERPKIPPDLLERVRHFIRHGDKTIRDTAVSVLREPAHCYQEMNPRREAAERYLVMCYWTAEQCEKTRGPNLSPGVTQTACQETQLAGATWEYAPDGWDGAWYQYSPDEFGTPFPQFANSADGSITMPAGADRAAPSP